MPDKDKIKRLFQARQESIRAELNLGNQHQNPNARGSNSEAVWTEALKKSLPSRYELRKGFVIDSEGNESDEIDIIIYDRFYSPYVFIENDVSYIPAESVYAVIECKPQLIRQNIQYAAEKAKSVRDLHRTSLPIKQMDGRTAAKEPEPILAGILTAHSSWTPPFGTAFNNALSTAGTTSPLDFGFCLNDGFFNITYISGTAQVSATTADDALIKFAIELTTRLQQMGNVPAIDLRKYYDF